jgi:sucrose-6-phosphate hydrolase SacC (GH32 family)
MDIVTIFISLVVAGLTVWVLYMYFSQPASGSSSIIQSTIQDGKKPIQSKHPMPRSKDQKEGLTFSYTCWLKIDDFAYRYGQSKVVFVKGSEDLKVACPALLVDANTNSLLVKMDTFGSQETISVPNIPAKKWIHVAIAVDQDSVDVYINGTLYTHHSITQVPKQNNMPVHTSVAGGFEGKLANLEYFDSFLDGAGVQAAMKSTPQPDPNDVGGPLPPYFDISWWTGRRT